MLTTRRKLASINFLRATLSHAQPAQPEPAPVLRSTRDTNQSLSNIVLPRHQPPLAASPRPALPTHPPSPRQASLPHLAQYINRSGYKKLAPWHSSSFPRRQKLRPRDDPYRTL